MRIGLTYDLRAEYLALGYGEEETAEFDQQGTIDALADAIESLGHTRRSHRFGALAGESARQRRSLGTGVQHRRRAVRLRPRSAGAGDSRRLRHRLHLRRSVGRVGVSAQRLVEDDRARRRRADRRLRRHRSARPTSIASRSAIRCSRNRSPKAPAKASRRSRWCVRKRICRKWRIELLDRYQQPVLVETFLPGREFTVGIVGTGSAARAIGSIEIVLRSDAEPEVYSYTNKEECETLVEYRHVTPRRSAGRRSRTDCARRVDRARLPRRRSRRHPLRRARQADVPRGQSARRSAPDALRSADDRHRDRHAVRGVDPRHRRLGRHANSEGARPRRLTD